MSGRGGFIARRLLHLIPVVLGITVISFMLSYALPADPMTVNLGELAAADPEVVASFRQEWGLDRSPVEQYLTYVYNLLQGNMGISISTRRPVFQELRQALPATYELAVASMLISIVVGIPLGVLAAVKRNTAVDQVTRFIALVGLSVPVFWLGLVGLFVFYAQLGWVPGPGRTSATIPNPPFVTGFMVVDALLARRPDAALDTLWHLVLPSLVLAMYNLGILARLMRSAMLEVLGEDYVRTARAKGLPERVVLLRHALSNALIPIITVIGLGFGRLLSGAVVTESVFAWPGLGLYAFRSATTLDFPAIMGVGIAVASTYLIVNLIVDITYAFADPRIRLTN
jgi:peptide/nickel transport system permease protein